jgi:hypothetical protein
MNTNKLDEEVAQHIMNWKKSGESWIDEDGNHVALKSFSTDLNATWEVVDKICDLGFRLQLSGSRIWQARFYKSASHTLETHAFDTTKSTPAEAICTAALSIKR